jgi:hypothetical protein
VKKTKEPLRYSLEIVVGRNEMIHNITKSYLLFPIIFLSGCLSHKIITPNDKDSSCKLLSAEISPVKNMQPMGAKFSAKRIDSNKLIAWVLFTPLDSHKAPLDRPKIILRLKKNEKIVDEVSIEAGMKHKYGDEYRSFQEMQQASSNDMISSKEIWPFPKEKVRLYVLSEMAVSFPLSRDLFDKILKSDSIQILIQTHSDPVIASLSQERLEPLREFGNTCLGIAQ